MNNLKKYITIFESVFNVNEEDLNSSFNFSDVGIWDSLAHLTLISELESEFDILLKTEDVLHFGGFENGKQILMKYGVSFD